MLFTSVAVPDTIWISYSYRISAFLRGRISARIQRRKNKLGTRSLPAAELELRTCTAGCSARRAATCGRSAPVLNITRTYSVRPPA